jgi:hypothetical protein
VTKYAVYVEDAPYTPGPDGKIASGAMPASQSGEAFPIGSLFFAAVSTNPATLLGYGTWAAWGPGRVFVCYADGDPDFGTLGAEGGAKTVAAAGSITINALAGGTRKGGTSNPGSIIENGNVPTGSFTGSATSVMQPFKVGYAWERTA